MAELTAEQLQTAETMSLDQLRDLAFKEMNAPQVTPTVQEPTSNGSTNEPVVKSEPARDANGRFVSPDDSDEDDDEDDEPAKTIYRKEVPNGDGSVDVYEAESWEDLVEK